jgi:hypothetical protein
MAAFLPEFLSRPGEEPGTGAPPAGHERSRSTRALSPAGGVCKTPPPMMTFDPVLRSASRALRALLLLGVLLLGAAFHFWHHVQDPACGSGDERTNHVCVACSGLHGSTLVAAEQPAPAPQSACWTDVPVPPHIAPAFDVPRSAAPRAPPAT